MLVDHGWDGRERVRGGFRRDFRVMVTVGGAVAGGVVVVVEGVVVVREGGCMDGEEG